MPVASRGARSAATSRSGTGRPAGPAARSAAAAAPPAAPPARGAGARSSASVFHSSQPGHWPCHLAATWPQAEQTKTVVGRAIGR